ncbi:MAG: hypothetical protein JF610_12685 [Acidobacteria bacterium]|nr:hypothetical protein [Acidobacteriota bacterium]
MSKTAARIALVCALVGLGVSSAAAYTHYQMLRDPTYHSFCDVSATVSCTQVYQSRYSTVAGMPVAIFGALRSRRSRSRSCSILVTPRLCCSKPFACCASRPTPRSSRCLSCRAPPLHFP